jgi:hypothetical protein
MASGPLIVGINVGAGPIQTYDFSTGGAPIASFVPTGASGESNGRGLEVIGSEVFYTELSNKFGPTPSIEVAPYHSGAGGPDSRTIPNPRPTTGVQDLSVSEGSLYALTGYANEALQVFKLNPSSGAVLAGPISISAPATPESNGFTVLPNGNFLINVGCVYNQYNGSTGALVSGTTITVPEGVFCSGVDTNGTSLFFHADSGITQTDMSGKFIARRAVSGEVGGIEDISLVQHRLEGPEGNKSPVHWQLNAKKSAVGLAIPVIRWGTVELISSEGGTLKCRTASAANNTNTAGGQAISEVVAFTAYECKVTGGKCMPPLEERATAKNLTPDRAPNKGVWPSVVVEEGPANAAEKFRSYDLSGSNPGEHPIELNIECWEPVKEKFEGATEFRTLPPVLGESGSSTPLILNGTTATKPSEISFEDPLKETGHLYAQEGLNLISGTTKGKFKFVGYLDNNVTPLITIGTSVSP